MMPAEKPTTKMGNNRRNNKPIMEKRRRARINSCLNDLKALILEALKKDPSRHSKLEKADILEMTVKHLQNLQRQQVALSAASNPCISNKFRAGFDECATEVQRYLSHMDGLDPCVQQRLVGHLTHCAKSLHEMPPVLHTGSMSIAQAGSLPATPQSQGKKQSCNRTMEVTANAIVNGLHLVPTRLPNGDLAFLLPGSYALGTGTHSMDTGNAICFVNSTTDSNNDVGVTLSTTALPIGATAAVTHVLAPQLANDSSTLPETWQSPDGSRSQQAMTSCDSNQQTASAFISQNSRVPITSGSTSFQTKHVPSVTSETADFSPPGCVRLPGIGSEDVCHVVSSGSTLDQEPWRPW